MKTCIHGFFMCQSMFCAIPSPYQGWDEAAKDKLMLFLPFVGLEIGLLYGALAWLCRFLSLPHLVSGALLTAFPFLITGFMHLDGFMDVTDAVKSWRDLERRREILKDSHVGSFSVIAVALLMILQFACLSSLKEEGSLWIFVWIPVVSRCCSALAVTLLKPMETSQYAGNRLPAACSVLLFLMLGAALTAGWLQCGIRAAALPAGAAGYGLALSRAYRSLKGMNGDVAGYCLTLSELAAAAVLVFL